MSYYLHVNDFGFGPGWRRLGPYDKKGAETQAAHDRDRGVEVEIVEARDSDARIQEHVAEVNTDA